MKKNGFTLVELLAVIAILAILVIIALPNVMGMFNTAKRNSFTTEIKEIYKQAQQQWISDSMLNTGELSYYRTNGTSGVVGEGHKIDLTGRKELDYYITIKKSGKVSAYYATDGSYQYYYTAGDLQVENIGTATSGENYVKQVSELTAGTQNFVCIGKHGSTATPPVITAKNNDTSSVSCY